MRRPIWLGSAGSVSLAIAGGLLFAATPGQAAKKQVLNVGPPIMMSDGFRAGVVPAQAALRNGDLVGAGSLIAALAPANDFENYIVAGLKLEAASRRGDVQAQRLALTDMFKTTSVPTSQAPRLRYMAALYSFYVGNYDDTIAQLTYAKTLGYSGTDATMLMADTYLRRGKPKEARPLVEQLFAQQRASGQPIPAPWYDKAISLAYQAGDWPAVGALYRERLTVYPSTANWRSAISNYLAAPGLAADVQLDLYRLQAAVGAMASERDYQAYATLAERNGHNAEAKAIIEAGRAAGKLQPTQAATVALMKTVTPKAAKDIVALPAKVKKASSDSSGKGAMAAGDTYFSLSQFPQAVEQYRVALTKGGIDSAQANSRLGVALARSGDLPGARAALAQATGEWSNVARFWSVWVDQQGKQGG